MDQDQNLVIGFIDDDYNNGTASYIPANLQTSFVGSGETEVSDIDFALEPVEVIRGDERILNLAGSEQDTAMDHRDSSESAPREMDSDV